MSRKPVDEQTLRRRACKGWAFRKWDDPAEEAAIAAFVRMESDEVPPFYAKAYQRVVENQSRPRSIQRKPVFDTPYRLISEQDPKFLQYTRGDALREIISYAHTPAKLRRAAWFQILRRLELAAYERGRQSILNPDTGGEEHCDVLSLTGKCPHPAGAHQARSTNVVHDAN